MPIPVVLSLLTRLTSRVGRSVGAIASRIEGLNQKSIDQLETEYIETINKHNLLGTDAAMASTKRYAQEQLNLINYRVVRFIQEARYIASGDYFRNYTYTDLFLDFRFLVKLFAIFLAAVMVGRRSIFPLMEPHSPFVKAIAYKYGFDHYL